MKKGFTLIELLIVLVIIGIIVGLILPNTLRAIQEANERECASNIRAVNTAIQLCYTSTRDWSKCDSFAELQVVDARSGQKYLDQTPVCPFGVAYTFLSDSSSHAGVEMKSDDHFATWPPHGIDHK